MDTKPVTRDERGRLLPGHPGLKRAKPAPLVDEQLKRRALKLLKQGVDSGDPRAAAFLLSIAGLPHEPPRQVG